MRVKQFYRATCLWTKKESSDAENAQNRSVHISLSNSLFSQTLNMVSIKNKN